MWGGHVWTCTVLEVNSYAYLYLSKQTRVYVHTCVHTFVIIDRYLTSVCRVSKWWSPDIGSLRVNR